MEKDKIKKNLAAALVKIGAGNIDADLEHPANSRFGDYSTSIALKLTKQLKKNPLEIAQMIADNFPKIDLVAKIDIVKPGFVNFWLATDYLINDTRNIAEENITYPKFYLGKEHKIMVEFAHPNTHKLFHIGHLRNISTGEAIVRILEAAGNKVIRTNYQGDVGLHIAKCLYQIRNSQSAISNYKSLNDKIKFLGEAYAKGQQTYETNEKTKQEILDINRMIYEQDPKIMKLWKETRQWSLEYYEEIYRRVGSHFDRLYFESELTKRGIELCRQAQDMGLLEKSQGAIVFNGKKYGLDTRVFINSLGLPTYEGKELALAEKEFSDFDELDKNIHVVTPEQKSFFNVTFKVEQLLDPKKYDNKQYHLVYEWVNLRSGKMSSREGNVIEGNWLLDETKRKIQESYKCDDMVAETLAVAAVKYSFLKTGTENQIAFDFNESISLEGNSGPYLLYTYVRTQSVLKKAVNQVSHDRDLIGNNDLNTEESDVLRTLYHFPEIVGKAAANFAPNLIANYLYDLAQKFNFFYQKQPILKAKGKTRNLRLTLTRATANVLKNGLYLLGINTVDKM